MSSCGFVSGCLGDFWSREVGSSKIPPTAHHPCSWKTTCWSWSEPVCTNNGKEGVGEKFSGRGRPHHLGWSFLLKGPRCLSHSPSVLKVVVHKKPCDSHLADIVHSHVCCSVSWGLIIYRRPQRIYTVLMSTWRSRIRWWPEAWFFSESIQSIIVNQNHFREIYSSFSYSWLYTVYSISGNVHALEMHLDSVR